MTINGQVPQIGDMFVDTSSNYNDFNNIRVVVSYGFMDHPGNPPTDTNANNCGTPVDFPAADPSSCAPQGTYYDVSPWGATGCLSCTPSAWNNYTNWTNTWTNSNNFNSSNPNQPCNHICKKITNWETKCQNVGPQRQNKLACKIEEGQNQSQIHNCNC
jgi:hypothetical protein